MKFSVDNRELNDELNIVMRAVPSRSSMPILECILIEATNNGLYFTSNDSEFGIQTEVDADVHENGQVCVDAKLFSDIARKLPKGDVNVEVDEKDIVTIRCGKSKFNIPGKSAEQFVRLPDFEEGVAFTVLQSAFRNLVQKTIFCVGTNDNNPMMTGVYLELVDDKLKATALDGVRIATMEISLDAYYERQSAVIPGRILSDISKILNGGKEDKVDIQFTKNHAIFKMSGETTMVTRLIAGQYFDMHKMLNAESSIVMYASRDELLECLQRCNVMVRDGDKKPVVFDITDTSLNVSITTQLGQVTESLDIEKQGPDIRIGFNPRFLVDAVNATEDGEVTIRLMSAKAPAFVQNEDAPYTYVVLPVQI